MGLTQGCGGHPELMGEGGAEDAERGQLGRGGDEGLPQAPLQRPGVQKWMTPGKGVSPAPTTRDPSQAGGPEGSPRPGRGHSATLTVNAPHRVRAPGRRPREMVCSV